MKRTVLHDEAEVISRILRHVDAKTTDTCDETWREPVSNYTSARRLESERKEVLMRFPSVFCPSAALREPGSYLARTAAGASLLVVRGKDGVVRGFKNACRHRGMELAAGAGSCKAFVCPFHGWTYDTDGSLLSVPHPDGFPDLQKSERGLTEVETVERHGLIWVRQGGPAPKDPLEPIAPALDAMGLGDWELFHSQSIDVPANWKILIEGYLEGYHIRVTHKESFYPYGFDNLNLVDRFGVHSRVIFPFRRVETLRDVAPDERRIHRLSTHAYQLFPNVVIAALSYHTQVLVFEPLSPDATRWFSYQLASAADLRERRDKVDEDVKFATTGNDEDMAVALGSQRSLRSGANRSHEFGRFEGAITHFHRGIDAALQ